MNEYMQSVLKNIKGYTKIYSSSEDGFDGNKLHEKCKNHEHTIVISKSNFAKILGGYSSIKWQKFEAFTPVTESFVFFYDEDKLRICT